MGSEHGMEGVQGDARHIADGYTVGEVASALGISRSTLLYYESHGLVRPEHRENGYRRYTNDDIYRLMGNVTLRNVGIDAREASALLDNDPFSRANLTRYRREAARQADFLHAVDECLGKLQLLLGRGDEVVDEFVEPYFLCQDESENGFRDYPDNEVLSSLLALLPVSSLGVVFNEDYFDLNTRGEWGRTIPQKYAYLVDDLPGSLVELGGHRCLTAVKHDQGVFDLRTEENTMSGKIACYMKEHGLRQVGRAFCPYTLITHRDGVYIMVCVPVDPA